MRKLSFTLVLLLALVGLSLIPPHQGASENLMGAIPTVRADDEDGIWFDEFSGVAWEDQYIFNMVDLSSNTEWDRCLAKGSVTTACNNYAYLYYTTCNQQVGTWGSTKCTNLRTTRYNECMAWHNCPQINPSGGD